MASSYDKVVKLACKPKAAPPKPKVSNVTKNAAQTSTSRASRILQYMDPIIAATWSEDGAVHDVCKALAPRFREPNAIVRPLANTRNPIIISVPTGRLQGSHRFTHNDTKWSNR